MSKWSLCAVDGRVFVKIDHFQSGLLLDAVSPFYCQDIECTYVPSSGNVQVANKDDHIATLLPVEASSGHSKLVLKKSSH